MLMSIKLSFFYVNAVSNRQNNLYLMVTYSIWFG